MKQNAISNLIFFGANHGGAMPPLSISQLSIKNVDSRQWYESEISLNVLFENTKN